MSREAGSLHRAQLAGAVLDVAPLLLGAVVTANGVSVRLTEVEAYDGENDPGSHAFRGPTPRTQVMFGSPGRSYVYFTYGMHWCLNAVTGPEGHASAVLLRAGEVLAGEALAHERRVGASSRDLARGPARMCKALALDGTYNDVDLFDPRSPLRLALGAPPDPRLVRTGPRVGVGGDGASYPWRFWLEGEPTVSPYRAAVVRKRSSTQ